MAVLTSNLNLCFEQKFEKYQNFYLKIFLVVKFSVNLNRLVLVMLQNASIGFKTWSEPNSNGGVSGVGGRVA